MKNDTSVKIIMTVIGIIVTLMTTVILDLRSDTTRMHEQIAKLGVKVDHIIDYCCSEVKK